MTSRAACLILCLAALRAEQLPVRIYTTADGLAGNTIDRIVTDSHGFLWFCTREGLSRFDGYQFYNFGVVQGLPGGANDLLEAADGDYWIATRNGLARFHPASPQPRFEILLPRDPKARVVFALAADPAGGMWVGTQGGLYHLDPASGQWQLRPVDIGMPGRDWEDTFVDALLVDRSGTLWAGTRNGLYHRFPDGRCEHNQGGLSQAGDHYFTAGPPGAALGRNAAGTLPDFGRPQLGWEAVGMFVPRKGIWRASRLSRCLNPRMVRYGSLPKWARGIPGSQRAGEF
jgi:hypothetical protein